MISKFELSKLNYRLHTQINENSDPSPVWWEDMVAIEDKLNEIINYINRDKK